MAQDEYLPLVYRQGPQRLANITHAMRCVGIANALVSCAHLLDRNETLSSDVVDRKITRDPEYPGEKGDVSLLVFADHIDQLGKHLLCDIFGLAYRAYRNPTASRSPSFALATAWEVSRDMRWFVSSLPVPRTWCAPAQLTASAIW
jgi:hypothetical protein